MTTLRDGTIVDESIDAVHVTSAANCPAAFGLQRVIKYITIHHWGAFGQRIEDVVGYLSSDNPRQSSAHAVIMASRAYALVSPDDAAWQAGTAEGNCESIGLELHPEATDGDYVTAAAYIAYLRGIYGDLPLVPHNHWITTDCPGQWDLARLDALARNTTITTGDITMALSSQELDQIHVYANQNGDRVINELRAQVTAAKNEILVAIKAISTVNGSGASLDLAAIAKAVADEEAKRLAN